MYRKPFLSILLLCISLNTHSMEVKHVALNSSEKSVNILMEGAQEGSKEKMAAALQNGAALEDQDQQGLTAFHHALHAHKSESIDFIMDILEQGEANLTHLKALRIKALRIKASLPSRHIPTETDFFIPTNLAIHPSKNLILTDETFSDFNPVKLWNERGEHIADIVKDRLSGFVHAAEFSTSGNLIFVACEKTIIASDLSGKQIVKIELERPSNKHATALSPQSNCMLSTTGSTVQLWNMKGDRMATLPHAASVITACFNHAGTSILTSCSDNTAHLWDLQGNKQASISHSFDHLHPDHYDLTLGIVDDPFNIPTFSPDDTAILTTGKEQRSAHIWNLKGEQIAELILKRKVIIGNALFSPNSKLVLTSSAYGKEGILWDLQGNIVARSPAWRESLVTFSPGGTRILSSIKNKALLSDLQGNILAECDQGEGTLICTAHFSPDGNRFVLAGGKTVSLWDLKGNKKATIEPNIFGSGGMFSPLSDYYVLGSDDDIPFIWSFHGTAVDMIIVQAVKSGNTHLLKKILSYFKKHGEPLTQYCKKSIISTIIHQAARIHKHNQEVYAKLLHIIQLLIDHTQALLDEKDEEGYLPLFWAHYYKLEEIANLVTQKGGASSISPQLQAPPIVPDIYPSQAPRLSDYFNAAQMGNLHMLEKNLGDPTSNIDAIDENGFNALHLACLNGQLEAIKLLLQQKRINIHEAITKEGPYHGWTPLHCACFQNKPEIILFLLNAGALPNIADKQGKIPLNHALTQANEEVINVFLNWQTRNSHAVDQQIRQPEAKVDAPASQAEDVECVVCFEPLQERYAADPCGHTRICAVCRPALKICPICRKPIEKWIKVFD